MRSPTDNWPGLGPRRAETVMALLPPILGIGEDERALVEPAVRRLDDFLQALLDADRADEVRVLIDALGAVSVANEGALPGALAPEALDRLVRTLFDREQSGGEALLGYVLRLRGKDAPSPWDIARSFRELAAVAFWSNPATDALSGFVPVWRRPEILAVDPSLPEATPWTSADRSRLDVAAIRRKLLAFTPEAPERWFRNDGRPRVAIIGSGPGGAAAASVLAADHDVVIFEAGPRFTSDEYPLDAMAAMALLYEGGLMTPTRDLDIRVLRPRAVGGGSVMNEGVTVRPRASTLDHWARLGAGIDRAALERALNDVERRQRFATLAEDRTTSVGAMWRDGLLALGEQIMVSPVLSDLASHAAQHHGTPHRDLKGERCLGCGLCNFGCRFGHHLTVDRTFLWDAERAGARVVPNAAVDRILARRDRVTGHARVTGIVLERDRRGRAIPVDHVLLAAGTPGSSALLLRSIQKSQALARLPSARGDRVGARFGFNVGAPAIARWVDRPQIPGYAGIQTRFVATKAGDTDYILENGFVPPGVLASAVPGFGADHRRLMGAFGHLGFAVNTIGTPSTGRIRADGQIAFDVDGGTMDTMRRTLALLIDGYLHAGAVEVWPGGVHPIGGPRLQFTQDDRGKRAAILARLELGITLPEHVQIGSGHPQGGLALSEDPERGVVDGGFRVHGTDNLFVADASLFPTTIVVNLQWLVMGLGMMAGRSMAARIAGR